MQIYICSLLPDIIFSLPYRYFNMNNMKNRIWFETFDK